MPAASSLLPWFAPRLSRPMIGVLNNLGHEMHYTRGEVLYESPGFFRPLMLVRRGIVARALMDPLHADPLLVSLSGPRALCVTRGYRTLAVAQNSVISTAICRFLESCRTSFTNGCSNRTRFPHKNACKRSGTS